MSTNSKLGQAEAQKLYNGEPVKMRGKKLSAEEISKLLYRYDQTVSGIPTIDDIASSDFERYKEQGYMAIARAFTDEEVQRSLEALMNLIHVDAKGAKLQFTKPQEELTTPEERELAIRKVADYVAVDEALASIAEHPKLLQIAETILGEKPKLVQDMALLKPPHGGGEKPWHQDMAYGPLAYNKPVVGFWIALDEASLDNGCMHVIPRSHMDGAVPHYAVRDWQICDTSVRVANDVAVPLQSGGMLVFHGMLHHGTPPNMSTKRRRALQLHYTATSARKIRPDEYKRIYTNEMTDAQC